MFIFLTLALVTADISVGYNNKEVPIIDLNKKYTAQIRYHGEFLDCRVPVDVGGIKIIFDNPVLVSPGQSIVLYDGDICLGGGIVK